jgi:hypothetical protein
MSQEQEPKPKPNAPAPDVTPAEAHSVESEEERAQKKERSQKRKRLLKALDERRKAMVRVPFTLRIDTEERAALKNLSKIEGRPINQLLNEAIKSYLSRRGREERSLEANLTALRAYRSRDPGYKRAIAAFVDAEASIEDPLEGEPIEGEFVGGQLKPAGPVQRKVREILGA